METKKQTGEFWELIIKMIVISIFILLILDVDNKMQKTRDTDKQIEVLKAQDNYLDACFVDCIYLQNKNTHTCQKICNETNLEIFKNK